MRKNKVIVSIIGAVLMAGVAFLEKQGIDINSLFGGQSSGQTSNQSSGSSANSGSGNTSQYKSGSKWSNTSPEINLHHVFEGEINRSGKPTGYHSRPGGRDADGAKLVSIRDKPNSAGVYTATIAVRDGNQWKEKFSSFFPDSLSADEVTGAIVNAYNKSSNKKAAPWEGPSGLGFTIQGYTTSRGGINTAFPVYRGNE